jgi:hypothetical protein
MKLGADNAMCARSLTVFSCLALGLAAAGCLKVESNKPPVAKIVVRQGSDTIAASDSIKFNGAAIKITLDGKDSSDADGNVVEYLWMRTDVPASARSADSGIAPDEDGGVKSIVPPFTGDPEPKVAVEVTLKVAGKYRYSLWVTDDDGAVSAPASVTLNVAAP